MDAKGALLKLLKSDRFDFIAPLHHGVMMRLTINLDDDLYVIGKGIAQAEDISISQAINRLLRQRIAPQTRTPLTRRNRVSGLRISHGQRPVTQADVRRIEQEDDLA